MNRAGRNWWIGALLCIAAPGSAQPISGGVSSLAVLWVQGEYRAPMICEIDGHPTRALRRVVLQPAKPAGPREPRLTGKLVLFDLEAPPGTRCYAETGGDQPNLIGTLRFQLDARTTSDTAQHDFDEILRRKGGFRFDVTGGNLRVGPPEASRDKLERVVLTGAELWVEDVKRGSDAYRRLVEFGGLTKRRLVLSTADGRSWSFELVEWNAPSPRRKR